MILVVLPQKSMGLGSLLFSEILQSAFDGNFVLAAYFEPPKRVLGSAISYDYSFSPTYPLHYNLFPPSFFFVLDCVC